MKIYDKEIYNREQNIKGIVLMIVMFLIGFFTGYIANNKQDRNNENISNDNTAYITTDEGVQSSNQ